MFCSGILWGPLKTLHVATEEKASPVTTVIDHKEIIEVFLSAIQVNVIVIFDAFIYQAVGDTHYTQALIMSKQDFKAMAARHQEQQKQSGVVCDIVLSANYLLTHGRALESPDRTKLQVHDVLVQQGMQLTNNRKYYIPSGANINGFVLPFPIENDLIDDICQDIRAKQAILAEEKETLLQKSIETIVKAILAKHRGHREIQTRYSQEIQREVFHQLNAKDDGHAGYLFPVTDAIKAVIPVKTPYLKLGMNRLVSGNLLIIANTPDPLSLMLSVKERLLALHRKIEADARQNLETKHIIDR